MPPRRLNFDTPSSKRRKTRKAKTPRLSSTSIGDNVGTANTKQVTAKINSQMLGWTLYNQNLTLITRGDSLSERQRDVINLRGFKIDAYFRTITQGSGAGLPSDLYWLNVAVVAPFQRGAADFPTDFFRARDNLDERESDFATTLGSMDLHTLPINTDKWTVLKHKRYEMPTYGSQIPGWSQKIDMYIPLNRQVTYWDTLSNSCNTPVYLLYWVCRGFQNSQVDAVVPFTDVQIRTTTFFRETTN